VSAESFLSSAVEVAVGIAGFAGIVAAIRHRDISSWAHGERILLRMLLLASGMAVSFALLPAVLVEAGLPEATIWRVGSGALLVWQVAIAVHRGRQFRATGTAPPFSRGLYAWIGPILLLQASNVYLGASWPYLLGVFSLLVNAFIFFLVLMLGRNGGEGAAG
jgi:hypothetical protein